VKALWAWNLHRPILSCAWFLSNNGDGEIRTLDRLVIKALISCQRTISTQKLKLSGKVLKYDLYYSLTVFSFENYNIYSKLRPFLNISTWRPRSKLKPFLATRFHWQRKLRQGDQELLDTSTWPFFNPGKQWSKNIKYYVFIVLAMIYLESFCEREMES
jgi:hypothetical protein